MHTVVSLVGYCFRNINTKLVYCNHSKQSYDKNSLFSLKFPFINRFDIYMKSNVSCMNESIGYYIYWEFSFNLFFATIIFCIIICKFTKAHSLDMTLFTVVNGCVVNLYPVWFLLVET